jgi:pyrroline-5-carboxylate reductase
MSLENKTLAFIGSGVMAEAMIKGLLHQSLIQPQNIIAADPHIDRVRHLAETYDVIATSDNSEAARSADILVISVKPQAIKFALDDINGHLKDTTLVLSIAAGVPISVLTKGCQSKYVVRSMPNTPGQIGQGITVWTATPDVSGEQRDWATIILGALGETLFMQEEKFLDMATALNGSGPSYVFLLMEALIDAGVHLGFSRQDSQKLVLQTMRGSVAYAIQSGLHPAELRNQVTSPGGTSAAAIYQLEKGGVRTVISRAVWAAYQLSIQLGNQDS